MHEVLVNCLVKLAQEKSGMFLSGVTEMAWDVLSRVTKTAWYVLSEVANLCGMFCPGWQKKAWYVLSQDVLSGSFSY